jgi:hypothetical protein
MIKILNTIAITLLIALISVIPATLVGPYVPGFVDLGLQRIAVAAWISGLICWFIARAASKSEQEAAHEAAKKSGSSGAGVLITFAFLFVAIGVAALLHFYGSDLLS